MNKNPLTFWRQISKDIVVENFSHLGAIEMIDRPSIINILARLQTHSLTIH